MRLVAGQSLFSPVDTTSVVVIRAPQEDVDLLCGGVAMTLDRRATGPRVSTGADPAPRAGTVLGKRYVDDDGTVEVLCTKAGAGSLSVGGTALRVKAATPLPASD